MTVKETLKPNYQALLNMASLAQEHEVRMDSWICFLDTNTDEFTPALVDSGTHYAMDEITESVTTNWEQCGTVGCLAGTYTIKYPDSINVSTISEVIDAWDTTGRSVIHELSVHLGLSNAESNWLFLWERRKYTKARTVGPHLFGTKVIDQCSSLENITSDAAINRLRKFIYFKLKQEEIHEAWNSRNHTKHAQSENTNHVIELSVKHEKGELTCAQ